MLSRSNLMPLPVTEPTLGPRCNPMVGNYKPTRRQLRNGGRRACEASECPRELRHSLTRIVPNYAAFRKRNDPLRNFFKFEKRTKFFVRSDDEPFSVVARCAFATTIVCPLESTVETQPQLQPVLLRLSAMISQYFTRRILPLLVSTQQPQKGSSEPGRASAINSST
jgi:hypothetical protein